MTGTTPPVDGGDGASEAELLNIIKGVIAALVVVVVSLVWLARTLGLKVAESIPNASLPFINLGQKAVELLTPGDTWDDEQMKKLAEGMGFVATRTATGSIIWTPKDAAPPVDPTVALMREIEKARQLLSSQGWNPNPPTGYSPTWLDEDTNG